MNFEISDDNYHKIICVFLLLTGIIVVVWFTILLGSTSISIKIGFSIIATTWLIIISLTSFFYEIKRQQWQAKPFNNIEKIFDDREVEYGLLDDSELDNSELDNFEERSRERELLIS